MPDKLVAGKTTRALAMGVALGEPAGATARVGISAARSAGSGAAGGSRLRQAPKPSAAHSTKI